MFWVMAMLGVRDQKQVAAGRRRPPPASLEAVFVE